MDEKAVLESVAKTGCIVTAEEHNYLGGMGESIAGILARKSPVPMEMVAVNDSFGESGKPMQLLEKYGLSTNAVIKKVRRVLDRKA
jgi:transketolase